LNILFVVNNPKDWPLEIPGVTVVPARTYLTDPQYFEERGAKVFNLCRSYKYQSAGYYVSLLAAARGHHPLPSLSTVQDLRSPSVARLLSEDLEALIQRALKPLDAKQLSLNIFFGRNENASYDGLAWNLFGIFEAPLLRADFVQRDSEWQLKTIRPLSTSELQPTDHEFLLSAASDYFSGKRRRVRRRPQSRYDLAILHDPNEAEPPSDRRALERFEDAAEALGFDVEFITKDDAGRVAEFDGLFIRETTAVNHHTFRIARRAEAEGLVVIDDSNSMLKCTNKVYLAELLTRQKIQAPKTLVVHADNIDDVVPQLGMPLVLKQPDSAFSKGVTKVDNEEQMRSTIKEMLAQSELIVAQAFLPTDFDWRVGIIDGRPLYVCKYFMARRHWQIIRRDESGETAVEGNCKTLAVGEAPKEVIQTALKAANLIGDGLYGVDLKEVDNQPYIIEVNDNPSIDTGYEDAILKAALYREIMSVFLQRIEAKKRGRAPA
jgi:glutathione synthase/RimK-type ligase-like ATP-grasp enzyme